MDVLAADDVMPVLTADWACYTKSADRADFNRLASILAAYPRGFHVYTLPLEDGTLAPVGYTGQYPISESAFHMLHDRPHEITSRGFMLPEAGSPYIYLFNYSIIPSLRGTAFSRQLVKNYAAEIARLDAKGLAAVTVSEDGARVAQKFGLSYRGDMTHDGVKEGVYAAYL